MHSLNSIQLETSLFNVRIFKEGVSTVDDNCFAMKSHTPVSDWRCEHVYGITIPVIPWKHFFEELSIKSPFSKGPMKHYFGAVHIVNVWLSIHSIRQFFEIYLEFRSILFIILTKSWWNVFWVHNVTWHNVII